MLEIWLADEFYLLKSECLSLTVYIYLGVAKFVYRQYKLWISALEIVILFSGSI